jgi:predicted DNA-binding transcriptional regulator AlpA
MQTETDSANGTAASAVIAIPRLLDCRGACAAIGGDRPVSRATLYRLTKAGLLEVYRLTSRSVRWSAEDIANYLHSVMIRNADEVSKM